MGVTEFFLVIDLEPNEETEVEGETKDEAEDEAEAERVIGGEGIGRSSNKMNYLVL